MERPSASLEGGSATLPCAPVMPVTDRDSAAEVSLGVSNRQGGAAMTVQPKSRWRRWMPDMVKVALALAVIGVAAAIWYKPILIQADFPYVSYCFKGLQAKDATLYRPLAMPTRYYIALPGKLAGRYEWFAVDRRREVVALTAAPQHRFLGRNAIKRSDPLGLDLEFRKLDGSEWQIHFMADSIVFSNALLSVRMDTKPLRPQ